MVAGSFRRAGMHVTPRKLIICLLASMVMRRP